MSRIIFYRWLLISMTILILAGALFFTIRIIHITLSGKSSDQHTDTTPARLVGTPHVLPSPIPSASPAVVTHYALQISSDPY
jgi:hypothetical protein